MQHNWKTLRLLRGQIFHCTHKTYIAFRNKVEKRQAQPFEIVGDLYHQTQVRLDQRGTRFIVAFFIAAMDRRCQFSFFIQPDQSDLTDLAHIHFHRVVFAYAGNSRLQQITTRSIFFLLGLRAVFRRFRAFYPDRGSFAFGSGRIGLAAAAHFRRYRYSFVRFTRRS